MPASRTDSLEFTPTARTLAFALDELAELGTASGGAVPAAERRAALETYLGFPAPRSSHPRRLRHDYAALAFDDLVWASGRVRVPAPPPGLPSRDASGSGDAPALAVDNAGGIVHAASAYLQPVTTRGDARVTLAALSDAVRAVPDRVGAVRGRIARVADDRFVALATAFQNCGAYVDVPPGIALEVPLQIVWTGAPGPPQAVFAQTVVRIGAGARVTIVERHVGNVDGFVCGTVELDVGPGARVDYVVVQEVDDGARALVTRAARCASGATVSWHLAELGGALVRSVVATQLAGPGARAETNALFFAREFTTVDLHVSCVHDAAHTTSQTLARVAATDRGVGRFFGDIAIAPHVRGAGAVMRVDGLVLSRDAYLEAVPTLAIATNDVSAAHRATIGSLDEAQLFYVRARGISRGRAEHMLALAFFEAAIAYFPSETLRDEIRTALDTLLEEIPDTFSA